MASELFYFMRRKAVDVLRYLPKFLAADSTFKDAQDTLSTEHEQIRVRMADLARQFWIDTATWSMTDWETFTGVKSTSDLEGRRLRVKAKLLGGEVMTVANVNKLIRSFTDGERSYADESRGANVLKIVLRDRVLYWYEMFESLMELTPAHLWIEFERQIETTLKLYAGFSEVKVGRQVIGLGRPTGGKLDLVAGVGVGQFGTRTIKLAVPEIWFGNENRLNAGLAFVRSGTVTIGADLDDLYKLPEIRECAIADLLIADVGIARPMEVPDVRENNSGYIGHVLIRQGTITIQADMSDLNGEPWIRECAAADLLIADVGIARPNKVGDAEPEIPEDDEEAVPEGLWLRNYFDFPTGRDHPVLLANPREDLTVGDVKAVGEYASANHILMNARAEGTLGIRKASLIHGYNLVTADGSQKLPTTGKVRLYFDFPSGQHRRILLQERRADMLVGDLKTFGEFTTTNKILMNARGEPSTGLTRASVIREFAVKALPAETPITF